MSNLSLGRKNSFLSNCFFTSFFLAVCLVAIAGCRGLSNAPTQDVSSNPSEATLQKSLNHIIIMLQENRSFDHYFGKLNDYRAKNGLPADVDGIPPTASNQNFSRTQDITVYKLITACTENPSPSWNESHFDIKRDAPASGTALMNGFAFTAGHFARDNGLNDIEGVRVMGYYDENTLPYYYFMATQFATSDRFFSPAPTRTQPNRMYLLSATSAGKAYPPTTEQTQKNIFQLLQENNISWKIYVTDPNGTYLTAFTTFANAHQANIVPISQYFTDVQAGTLPSVALIESGYESGRDEHAPGSVQVGAQYAASIINALMASPSWKDSVFFLSFDEGGGYYDHVPPPAAVSPDGIAPNDLFPTDVPGDFTIEGFRIPLIVISPFTKRGFVSHTQADYTAFLKFIENRFNLPSLTKRDAAQPDLTEFFDFTAATWATPPNPPAQPVDAPCYGDHLP
jgi:phospholipase C